MFGVFFLFSSVEFVQQFPQLHWVIWQPFNFRYRRERGPKCPVKNESLYTYRLLFDVESRENVLPERREKKEKRKKDILRGLSCQAKK